MGVFDTAVKLVKGLLAHDAADTAANTPVKVGGYGSTATPSATSADGDVTNIWVTRTGAVNVADAGGSLTVDGAVAVSGDVAHDVADSGNPVKVGGKASASAPTAVTDGDRVNAYFDQQGRIFSRVQGLIAQDTADNNTVQYPVKIGGGGSAATPGAVSADGDIVNGWFTLNGALNVADGNGTLSVDDGADSLTVDGTVAVSGVGGTVTSTAVGTVAHDAPDAGNPLKIGGKAYTSAPSAVSDADRVDAYFDTQGRLQTRVQGLIPQDTADDNAVQYPIKIGGGGSTATPGAVSADGDIVNGWFTRNGALNVADGNGSLTVDAAGDVAHDAADSGNPIKIGGKASTSTPSAVSNGDRVNAYFNATGSIGVHDGDASLTIDNTGLADLATRFTATQTLVSEWSYAAIQDTGGGELMIDTADDINAASTVTTASLDHSTWTTTPKYIYIPVNVFSGRVVITLLNEFNQAIAVELRGYVYSNSLTHPQVGEVLETVAAVTAATGKLIFANGAGGSGVGGSYKNVPAMAAGFSHLALKVTPALDPTNGGLTVLVARGR